MLSPLQLKSHRFIELHLEGIPKGIPDGDVEVTTTLGVGRHKTEPREWRVDLKVAFEPAVGQNGPYKGTVEVVGFFEILDGWPEKDCEALVTINGASLLYGAIREMVLMMSSRSSHGEFLLQTLNFQAMNQAPRIATKSPAKKTAKKVIRKIAKDT
jgi:preprotein translocase subunit SecB